MQTGCVTPAGDTGNSANCGNALAALTDAGSYALSVSPSGTFDQGGNVWEWNEAIFGGNPPGSLRGVRGGSWLFPPDTLAASSRGKGGPADGANRLGFRVASIPEPSTALLLMSGLLVLASRRSW